MSRLVLDKFEKKRKEVPIWLMRQAGRYLPEYKKVREEAGSFLDLCYNPKLASEVTLQPIRRFDFDAAILFSDILVIPHALSLDVEFQKNIGPIVEKIESEDDLKKLNVDNIDDKLKNIYETVRLVKSQLPSDKTMIGFAGSIWTVATYILEGRGKTDFSTCKKIAYSNKNFLNKLFDILIEATTHYLLKQIEAGCDIIQLFDSWSGVLSGDEYDEFVIAPTKRIVSSIKSKYPNIPIIGFPKGSYFLYEKYIKETGIDGVGIDQYMPLEEVRKLQKLVTVQGNLDPVILLSSQERIKQQVDHILESLSPESHIFNLGHGILQNTPIENVEFLVNYIRSCQRK